MRCGGFIVIIFRWLEKFANIINNREVWHLRVGGAVYINIKRKNILMLGEILSDIYPKIIILRARGVLYTDNV